MHIEPHNPVLPKQGNMDGNRGRAAGGSNRVRCGAPTQRGTQQMATWLCPQRPKPPPMRSTTTGSVQMPGGRRCLSSKYVCKQLNLLPSVVSDDSSISSISSSSSTTCAVRPSAQHTTPNISHVKLLRHGGFSSSTRIQTGVNAADKQDQHWTLTSCIPEYRYSPAPHTSQ